MIRSIALLLLMTTSVAAQGPKASGPGKPLSPEEARKAFQVPPGLKIELVASEPNIESPVAISFAPDGRLWVVEMLDYPNGPGPGKPGQGRIRVLEDRDGDGFFEHSQIFAEGLLFANGLLPWKDGVIVTMAPHIAWLRDTDGDGKADKTEILYEGFTAANPQLRVSHPILGLDGWVYVANGLRGGMVKAAGEPKAKTINLGGMDFRFNLLTGAHEAITGMGQYGNTFDDWGNRFVCDNRHHLRHVVLENRYLKNNPHVLSSSLVEDISILDDGPLNSGGKIYPLSKNWTTSNLHEGRFTAACGVFIYRGSLLPKEYQGAAFTCDPTGNLVHAEALEPHGATFKSRPLFKEKEFLATPDDWCRPVFLAHGPDDALYVVDMYRAVIEHPEFMPPELKKRPDLTLGKEKGRIWRIVPSDHRPAKKALPLARKTSVELVPFLESGNAWERQTAFRLLTEQRDKGSLPNLRKMLASPHPVARIQAPWLIHSAGELAEVEVISLLRDKDSRVALQGVLLAELRKKPGPDLHQAVTDRAGLAKGRLAFQATLTLGSWKLGAVENLVSILSANAEDLYTRNAVYLALEGQAGQALAHLIVGDPLEKLSLKNRKRILNELATLVGRTQNVEACRELFHLLSQNKIVGKDFSASDRLAVLVGLVEGLSTRNSSLALLQDKLGKRPPLFGSPWFVATMNQAWTFVRNDKEDVDDRFSAIGLVAQDERGRAEERLFELLRGDFPVKLKLAALHGLGRFQDKAVARALLGEWKSLSPPLRRELLNGLTRHPDSLETLFRAIEEKKVKPAEIDPLVARQLMNHPQPTIGERSKKLLGGNLPLDRKEILVTYQAALKIEGDAKRGKDIFAKHCITCHRVAGSGTDVGPDISDTRTKTLPALLADILNPNQAIDGNYIQYLVSTKSGRLLIGILATETATSLTIKRAEGLSDVVPRSDIESIESTGLSLMPDGLERTISIEEMADLLAFLKNWRYLDGSIPVGK